MNKYNPKWELFRSGYTEEEKEAIAEEEAAEKLFAQEQAKVLATMNTPGWKMIIDRMVAEMKVLTEVKLPHCKEKELARLQVELKVRKEFLDQWTPYITD